MPLFKKHAKAAEAAEPSAAPEQTTTTAPPVHKKVGEVTANDTESQMTQVAGSEAGPSEEQTSRRRSWFKKSKKDDAKDGNRKGSISDSGPYIFAFDPATGKEVLQKNPHWPNEDSWKREDKTGWSMGSMFGNQKTDFGGTTG